MYQINFDGYQIYDPRLPDYFVRDPAVRLAVGEAGSLSFTIDASHPNAGKLTRLKGTLELLSDGVPIFRGRILSDTQDFDLARTIEAEGLLACLNDSVVPPYSFPDDYSDDAGYAAADNVVQFWLGKLLESHNAQVTSAQQIKLGTVTVTDANNYISRSSTDYAATWSVLSEKLAGSSLGGYLMVRYETDGTYLDYLSDFPLSNTQSVQFAENLLDLSDEMDATEVYTSILPVGKDGLTIASLTDGALTSDLVKSGSIIYSAAGVAKYGQITAVQSWSDVTDAANLRTKAAALLAQSGVLPMRTITVTAVDLHCTDGDIAAIRVGRYTPVTSAPHDLNVRYAITELAPDIMDPGNTRITLGAAAQTQTDRVQAAISGVTSAVDKQQAQLEQTKAGLTELAQTTQQQITAVLQTSQQIILSALEDYATTSDLESLRETVSAQLSVMADQVEIRLTQTTQHIETVAGDEQAHYAEMQKAFRFTEDGLIIGESGNEITLRVDNDRISFLDGGLEVAYISNKQLYITDAHFLNSLRIGKFAWIPRASGNLSLVRVGE